MHGNLWELVDDRYADWLGNSPVTDPEGAGGGGDVVMRGGGWEAWLSRSASRLGTAPDDRGQTTEVGFRVAATTVPQAAFVINNGLNDAWFDAATAGQGFFIIVFPDREEIFLALVYL